MSTRICSVLIELALSMFIVTVVATGCGAGGRRTGTGTTGATGERGNVGVGGTGGNTASGGTMAGVTLTRRGTSGEWQSVASSADGTKLVAVENGGYIYRSTDSGVTWTKTSSPAEDWWCVASSADGTKLVAVVGGVEDGYIYTSGDSGVTWTQTASQKNWYSVASSADGTKLVAVAKLVAADPSGYIYTSTDSGATWTQAGDQDNWIAVASSADGTKLIAAVHSGYIYISGDSGATWTQTGTHQVWNAVASSADGSKLVAAVSGGYLYTSADAGATWTQTDAWGIWGSVASSADGTKLVAARINDNYISTSEDSGATWTNIGTQQDWMSVASSADGAKLVAVAFNNYIYTWSGPYVSTGGTGGATSTGGTAGAGGATSSASTTSAAGMTANGDAGVGGAGGATAAAGKTSVPGTTGGSSGSGGSTGTPPSCNGLAATCGPSGNDDCCTSLLVPGGTYYRSYDDVDFTDKSYPALVDDFYLDKYEITVGRFRAFVNAGMGTQASPPTSGAGANPLITGSGWDSTWNPRLLANTDNLEAVVKCWPGYQTWTDTAGSNESQPMNCLDWYTAFAFCAWDGGRLPTEAEWNYAASGGSEQRHYPWSSPPTSTAIDDSYAVYCGGSCGTTQNVGSKSPKGDGKWGQSDLAGNVWEWTLDWFASPYPIPCNNCANMTASISRVIRGGDVFSYGASFLRSAYHGFIIPENLYIMGSRCARRLGGSTPTGGVTGTGGTGSGGPEAGGTGAGGVLGVGDAGAGGTSGGGSRGGSTTTSSTCSPTDANSACFARGKASGVLAGNGWIALGAQDTSTSPVCAPDPKNLSTTQPITSATPCPTTGVTVWNSTTGLCIIGNIPLVAGTPADYTDNWGLQIGVNVTATTGTITKSYSTITFTTTGAPSPATAVIRAQIHRVQDPPATSYCATMVSGTPILFTSFNTECWPAADANAVAFTAADVTSIDKVAVSISSDINTAYSVSNYCLTGVSFGM